MYMQSSFIPRKERINNKKKKVNPLKTYINTHNLNKIMNNLLHSLSSKKKHTYDSMSRSERNKKKFRITFPQLLLIGFIVLVIVIPYIMS